MSNTDFIREVDEEVRREQLEQLWRKWGKYALALAVVFIASVAGFQAWRQYQNSQAEAAADQFLSAYRLMIEGKAGEAATAMASVAASAPAGYRGLIQLQEAAARVGAKDTAGAVAILDRVATDSNADAMFRELAGYLAVLHVIDSASVDELEKRLSQVANAGPMLRFPVKELQAMVRLKADDVAGARKILQDLADQADAPAGIRGRAAELLAALGGSGEGEK